MGHKSVSKALRAVLTFALVSWVGGSSAAHAQSAISSLDGRAALAATSGPQKPQETANHASATRKLAPGVKQKITGVIAAKDHERLLVTDENGQRVAVDLMSWTKIEEKKSNPFRGTRHYTPTQLVQGLSIEVEGRGSGSGALEADKIRFTNDDLVVAQTVESRVSPVEGRLSKTETRLTETEENANRLSGQLEELDTISNAARGGAKAAQESADAALDGVDATNERISTLDDYQVQRHVTVTFRSASASLSDEAKAALDEVAEQVKSEKGYVIQVAGFASTDGKESFNRRLSQRRADAVVQYLVTQHDTSLRRIITPFGYGETHPVADNSTRDGREQNRRVEVSVLVSRGITSPANVRRPNSAKAGSSSSGEASELRSGSGVSRDH